MPGGVYAQWSYCKRFSSFVPCLVIHVTSMQSSAITSLCWFKGQMQTTQPFRFVVDVHIITKKLNPDHPDMTFAVDWALKTNDLSDNSFISITCLKAATSTKQQGQLNQKISTALSGQHNKLQSQLFCLVWRGHAKYSVAPTPSFKVKMAQEGWMTQLNSMEHNVIEKWNDFTDFLYWNCSTVELIVIALVPFVEEQSASGESLPWACQTRDVTHGNPTPPRPQLVRIDFYYSLYSSNINIKLHTFWKS